MKDVYKRQVLEIVKDHTQPKQNIWGINARNREQNFALNLLMDPEIDFVSLLGQAGTGKTLLTLAAGLTQVLDSKLYSEIIMTRVTVSVGEDIGFLPGTEEEKMGPWMGALDDNLDVLNKSDGDAGEWGRAATQDLIRSRIKVKSLNFMRGRTFLNKFLIIDEAQNLTPKQMKDVYKRQDSGMPFTPDPSAISAPTTKRFGTGLGIPFAFKVCDVLGGELKFEARPGGGTIVSISLPRNMHSSSF